MAYDLLGSLLVFPIIKIGITKRENKEVPGEIVAVVNTFNGTIVVPPPPTFRVEESIPIDPKTPHTILISFP